MVTTSYTKRISNSIAGIVIGLILFLGSFGMLYSNEGKTDMSKVAKKAVVVDVNTEINSSLDGKLVSVYGDFVTEEKLDDELYLKPGNYLAIERVVEMYSWEEESKTTTKEHIGGSETTETTYSYKKVWSQSPQDSDKFKENYVNPEKEMGNKIFKAKNVNVGEYNIGFQNITLPPPKEMTLKPELLNLDDKTILKNSHIYRPTNIINYDPINPQIGDLRISYKYIPSGATGTVFGALQGNRITSYTDTKGNVLFRMLETTHELAVSQMHSEFTTSRWMGRIIGFLMMWIGLLFILGIVSTILTLVPFLASISRGIMAVVTFIISLIFTSIIIIVSQVLHSWVALLIVLALIITAILFAPKYIKNKKIKVS